MWLATLDILGLSSNAVCMPLMTGVQLCNCHPKRCIIVIVTVQYPILFFYCAQLVNSCILDLDLISFHFSTAVQFWAALTASLLPAPPLFPFCKTHSRSQSTFLEYQMNALICRESVATSQAWGVFLDHVSVLHYPVGALCIQHKYSVLWLCPPSFFIIHHGK